MKKQLMILTITLAGTGLINAANKDLASQVASLQKAVNDKILPAIQEQAQQLNALADKITKIEESKAGKASPRATKEATEEPEEETTYEVEVEE